LYVPAQLRWDRSCTVDSSLLGFTVELLSCFAMAVMF
jgi:hypothetical protein